MGKFRTWCSSHAEEIVPDLNLQVYLKMSSCRHRYRTHALGSGKVGILKHNTHNKAGKMEEMSSQLKGIGTILPNGTRKQEGNFEILKEKIKFIYEK